MYIEMFHLKKIEMSNWALQIEICMEATNNLYEEPFDFLIVDPLVEHSETETETSPEHSDDEKVEDEDEDASTEEEDEEDENKSTENQEEEDDDQQSVSTEQTALTSSDRGRSRAHGHQSKALVPVPADSKQKPISKAIEDDSEDSSEENDQNDPNIARQHTNEYQLTLVTRCQPEFQLLKCLLNNKENNRQVWVAEKDEHEYVINVSYEKNYASTSTGEPTEVQIMRRINHIDPVCPVLLRLTGWCPINDNYYAMYMPYCENANAVQTINGNPYLVAIFMRQLLYGLYTLHQHGISHRDIAMENILWNPVTEELKIIDFDCADIFPLEKAERVKWQGYYEKVGRPGYDAPEKREVIKMMRYCYTLDDLKKKMAGYDERADIYAAGVVMWMLLNIKQEPPRYSKLKKDISKMKEKHHYLRKKRALIPPQYELMLALLNGDPRRRITILEAMQHPFLNQLTPSEEYKAMRQILTQRLSEHQQELQQEEELEREEQEFNYEPVNQDQQEQQIPEKEPLNAIVSDQ